jgi:hypothetical protein
MASIDRNKAKRVPPPAPGGEKLDSEYGHSSGDRNTRTDEHDWKHFKDGKEHTEHVDTGREPSSDPRRRQ